MSTFNKAWAPAILLALGALVTLGIDTQRSIPLQAPLEAAVPARFASYGSRDLVISDEEQRVAGMSDYLMRVFQEPGTAAAGAYAFSLYVGYYESQTQGKTIHSPKNCLPGAGWEPLEQESITIDAQGYRFPVNRYVLENKGTRALVYYWYQGRGRVSANEYLVKWEQIRDRALKGRSDEALVRIVIPLSPKLSLASADSIAVEVSKRIVRPIYSSLPEFPARAVPAPQTGS